MRESKSCFFIGHRDSDTEIYPSLLAEVERHVTEYGVTDFFVGHYGRFDRMAAPGSQGSKKVPPRGTPDAGAALPPRCPSHRNTEGLRWHLLPLGGRAYPQAPCHHQNQPAHGGYLRLSHCLRLAFLRRLRPDRGVRP